MWFTQKAYCGAIGYEYMFIQQRILCNWLRSHIENTEWVSSVFFEALFIYLFIFFSGANFIPFLQSLSEAEKKRLLHDLILADR